jgi:hypothetical protein
MGTITTITFVDWIQFFTLLVALGALIYQIVSQRKEDQNAETRSIHKLEIFLLCHEEAKKEEEIIAHFKSIHSKIDSDEVRKSIYEMLKDQTLRYRSNQTFKARRNKAKDEEGESTEVDNGAPS